MSLSPSPLDLTTVANLQGWLNDAQNVSSDTLQRLVTAASQFIQTVLNRTIKSQSYTDVLDGRGTRRIFLGNRPVTAVSSVQVDGLTVPPSPGPGLDGYVWSSSSISLIGYAFTRGAGNVVISYTAGYPTVPFDLEQACLELCAFKWRKKGKEGNSSIAMGGQQTNFTIRDMPPEVATILQNYREVVPC